jgi:hypothetical protein
LQEFCFSIPLFFRVSNNFLFVLDGEEMERTRKTKRNLSWFGAMVLVSRRGRWELRRRGRVIGGPPHTAARERAEQLLQSKTNPLGLELSRAFKKNPLGLEPGYLPGRVSP